MIWPDGFTLHDDLTLLEGIEACGFGNWSDLKYYMSRPKDEPVNVLVRHWFAVYGKNGVIERTDKKQISKNISAFKNN